MAINRFYQPAQSQYVSQFVPEELPTDLMLNILSKKQAIQDEFTKNATLLADWNQKALSGDDTAKIEAIRAKNQEFYNQIGSMNFTDPNAQKMYFQHVRDIKNNKEIERIAAAYEHNQAMMELEKKQKETGNYAHSKAQWDLYYKQLAQHTTPGSKGALGDQSIYGITPFRGVDVTGELLKIFNVTNADDEGYFSMVKTLDGLYAHASKYGGISLDKLTDQQKLAHSQIMQGDIGRELTAQFDNRYFAEGVSPLYAKQRMTEEQRKDYEAKLNEYVVEQSRSAAYLLRYKTADESTKAAAYNQGIGSANQKASVVEMSAPGSKTGDVDVKSDFNTYTNNVSEISRNTATIKQMRDVIALKQSGKQLTPQQEQLYQQAVTVDSKNGLKYVDVLETRNAGLRDQNVKLESRAATAFSRVLIDKGGANASDTYEYVFGFNNIIKNSSHPKHKSYTTAWKLLEGASKDESIKDYVKADPKTNPKQYVKEVLSVYARRAQVYGLNDQDIDYLADMGAVHEASVKLIEPSYVNDPLGNAFAAGGGAFAAQPQIGITGGVIIGGIAYFLSDKSETSDYKEYFDDAYNQAGTAQAQGVILDPKKTYYHYNEETGQRVPVQNSAVKEIIELIKSGNSNFRFEDENHNPVNPMYYDFENIATLIEDQNLLEENDGRQVWTTQVHLKKEALTSGMASRFQSLPQTINVKVIGYPGQSYHQKRNSEQLAIVMDPNLPKEERLEAQQNLIRRNVSPSVNQQIVEAHTMRPGDFQSFTSRSSDKDNLFVQRDPKVPDQYVVYTVKKGFTPVGNPTTGSFQVKSNNTGQIIDLKGTRLSLYRLSDTILQMNGQPTMTDLGIKPIN